MRSMLVLFALVAASCGGSSPAPSPIQATPTPTPTPSTITLTGRVTATNGGQALSGLTATIGAVAATTDAGGAFSAQTAPASTMTLALSGSSIVPRSITVAAATSRAVAITAIALGGGFDLAFYRQLVRNTFDAPGTLQPLRRLTRSPSLFIQTTDLVDARTLDMIETVAREAAPTWTSGALAIAGVERGAGLPRQGQGGWLTVAWSTETAHCGQSDVGFDGGTITLFPKRTTCACEGFAIARVVVRHELGHAFGYYHTDGANDVMAPSGQACNAQPSPRELAHAAIAYARPVGNADPDTDPSGAVNLTPMRVR